MASSKKSWLRTELLERWREIDEIDETAWSDPSKIQQLKEEWFLDAFNFLICLPKETHIWCGSWELMGPLLETFYNYFKENDDNAPLKILWRRISQEMRQCTQCACQHHQGQETYNSEYELSTVGPLLNVLRSLDEERVIQHLKEINLRIEKGQYDPELHNVEVVSVMFEVLMFPLLLDDQCLANEFQIFIEAIDSCHELTLSGHQQYPGVYALLFLKSRRTRAIGLRLSRCIGKLRGATELEPLQPLLKKCIDNLETETLPSTSETSKPRVQLERINIWLGIKSLLGFLEPPAFEEGILERYPNFLSIVLNHVSDDSPEFAHAVNCLRLLFEMLGCKLWLKTAFSPSVMRNTLLSMCFHTRNEKSHKDIFDLFEPFLQSLEALQDGEHETQRRHFLYFLLHQVKMSSNFSVLMRKKACQIAVLIIHRGYKMNPPCPPFECAHMWGPSLICSAKDSTLHSSLRQPAFDLIHTIIVSDAAALSTLLLSGQTDQCTDNNITDFNDEADENPFYNCSEEKDISCWSEYSVIQNKLTSRDCKGWMCVPVLWFELLVETKPSVLPATFHKAILWAISRFAMVELDTDSEVKVSVQDLLPPSAGRMPFVWEVPTGSDDGGDGKESKNSVKALTMCIPLIKMFKRFTGQFIIHMEHEELWKQWKWEPRMAETVILLLLEPNYAVRHVNRLILEHLSNVQGLACGLQFLSSSIASLSAIYLGLRHAMKLVQLDLVLSKFHDLHHCFFLLNKLLQEAASSSQKTSTDLQSFSSQGGFLRQPVFDDSPVAHSNVVDPKILERFLCLLCEVLWPPLRKCLVEGKKFLGEQNSQMTCVRILEILPVLFERLGSSKSSGNEVNVFNLKWLHDFMDWGESSLVVIGRYWRQSLVKLLDLLNRFCDHNSRSIVEAIEALISDDGVAIEELKEQVSRLSAKLSSQVARSDVISSLRKHPISEDFPARRKFSISGTKPSCSEDVEVHVLESPELARNLDMNKVIHLSDDEVEDNSSLTDHCQLNENNLLPAADKSILHGDREKSATSSGNVKNFKEACQITSLVEKVGVSSQKLKSDASKSYPAPTSLSQLKGADNSRKGINNICHSRDVVRSQVDVQSLNKNSRAETVGSKALRTSAPETVGSKAISLRTSTANSDRETRDTIIKEIIWDTDDDPWERAVRSARRPLSLIAKPVSSIPKRQVIQLNMPGQSKSGHFRRDAEFKRLRPPRLDDWYRPILEMDYFSIVGLSSANEDEKATTSVLREVPVSFKSSEHYVDIFRPLVLEELKAQLRSSFVEASSSEEMCSASISVLSVERIDDFHLIRCLPVDSDSAAGRTFSENDLVLLTKHPLENSSHDIHVVGKVERREKDNNRRSVVLVIRFYLQNGFTRLNKVKRFLTERSKWYLSRIMSITPQLREFQALSSLRDIPMLPVILNPTIHSPGSNGLRKVDLAKLRQPLQHVLKSSFNESQLWAISTAIGNHGSSRDFELSLIQGPPGTGKTRTILAIVSGLLACRSQQKNDTLKQLNCSLGPSKSLLTNSRSLFSEAASITRSWHDLALASQLNKEADKISKSADYSTRARVLICAQSNAAVDELVSRISKEGLYGSDGATYQPYLVRVGNAKTVHPSSLGFFIDTLVDQRLAQEKMNGTDKENDKSADTSTTLRANLEKLMDTIKSYEAQRANMMDEKLDPKLSSKDGAPIENSVKETSGAAVNAKLKNLKEQKRELLISLNAAQAREKKTSEESKALRNKLRKTILREAEIVVSTLSGCGGDLYGVCSESLSTYKFGSTSEHTLFDAVVIDEAAQALEPATLIPLQLLKTNGTKCIMVGDPKQLPATVISHVASKFLYECSMFERLQRAGHAVTMLTHQYRMHPEICRFPSLHFYDNKLLNGEGMSSKVAAFHENEHLGPYVFFDVIDGQECRRSSSGAQSLYNECEADAAVEVLRFFKKRYPSEFGGKRIGIISPYRSQVSVLRSRFSDTFGPGAIADMEFNTVDGFQGREVDILIFSTVRSSDLSSVKPGNNSSIIGFVADVRRMNVALTRAKISLWILGNANTLWTNQSWAALLENANERNLIVSMAKPYKSMFEKHSSASGMNQNICQSEGYSKENDQKKPCPGSGVNQKISQSAGCSKETKSRPKNVGKPKSSGQEQSAEGAPKSSKNGMKQNKSKKVDNNQEEVPEGCKRPNGAGAPNDLITKRKQQREAVDALLSSAFLPSKKPETTSNSRAVKRPASPTKRAIRPAKQRKDQ